MMIATCRMYLTADKSRLVGEGSSAAAFLYCPEGGEYDEGEAAKLGWWVAPEGKPEVVPEAKAVLEPPVNKAVEWPPAVKRRPRLIRRKPKGGTYG